MNTPDAADNDILGRAADRPRRHASDSGGPETRCRPSRCWSSSAAHAAARDAVHDPLDSTDSSTRLREVGIDDPLQVSSRADLAQRVSAPARSGPAAPADLSGLPKTTADIGFVLADGLSPHALTDHAAGMIDRTGRQHWRPLPHRPAGHRHPAASRWGTTSASPRRRHVLVLIGDGRASRSPTASASTSRTRRRRTHRRRPQLHLEYPSAGRPRLPDGARQSAAAARRRCTQIGRSGIALKTPHAADLPSTGSRLCIYGVECASPALNVRWRRDFGDCPALSAHSTPGRTFGGIAAEPWRWRGAEPGLQLAGEVPC